MDKLIGHLVANTDVERSTAEQVVGIVLQCLVKEGLVKKGPGAKSDALIAALPAAQAAIESAPRNSNAGSLFGGGVMAAGSRMMAVGLRFGRIQSVTRETVGYARQKTGERAVSGVGGAIPGLSQFA
jgi:hypothetical protein